MMALLCLHPCLHFSQKVTELLLINLVYGSRSTTKILDLQDGFCHQTPTYLWFLISTLRHSIKLWLESLICQNRRSWSWRRSFGAWWVTQALAALTCPSSPPWCLLLSPTNLSRDYSRLLMRTKTVTWTSRSWLVEYQLRAGVQIWRGKNFVSKCLMLMET